LVHKLDAYVKGGQITARVHDTLLPPIQALLAFSQESIALIPGSLGASGKAVAELPQAMPVTVEQPMFGGHAIELSELANGVGGLLDDRSEPGHCHFQGFDVVEMKLAIKRW
jgi:hypothetical protein